MKMQQITTITTVRAELVEAPPTDWSMPSGQAPPTTSSARTVDLLHFHTESV